MIVAARHAKVNTQPFFQDTAFNQLLQNTPQSFHFHPYLASRYSPFRDPVDRFHRVRMFSPADPAV